MSMVEIDDGGAPRHPRDGGRVPQRQWGAEKKNQVDFYNRRFVAGELESESFAGIAKAMGAEGDRGRSAWRRRAGAAQGRSTCR
jgi:sulfoacetaldehyde acetyltransferase